MTALRLADAASRLGISARSLQRLIANGEVRAIHPTPRTTRVTDRELEAYIAHLEGRQRPGRRAA